MKNKNQSRFRRHRRIRLKLRGTEERPRLVLRRSLKNLSAQIVDDLRNKTIFSLATHDKELRPKFPGAGAGNIKAAGTFGELFAKVAKEKGITKIIFDRAGYMYHGRVKAFAEALRKGGLEF